MISTQHKEHSRWAATHAAQYVKATSFMNTVYMMYTCVGI